MHPALTNAQLCIDLEADVRRERAESYEGWLWRAIMLAPTLALCRALLADEKIPPELLDQHWVRRFGLKR